MNQEIKVINIPEDINVFYVTAESFPEGIMKSRQDLHTFASDLSKDRKYYGISRPENGVISYKAAMTEISEGELADKGLVSLTIAKGDYLSINIVDYMKDIPQIGRVFQELISQENIDPNGYCIEYYEGKDALCMVKSK